MPGYREVARCARCGSLVDAQILSRSKCSKCGQDLSSCAQCVHFDPGARFECTQADHRAGVAQGRRQRVPVLHRRGRPGSAKPHLRSATTRLSRLARARRSTISSSFKHAQTRTRTTTASSQATRTVRVTIPVWLSCRSRRTGAEAASVRHHKPVTLLLFTQTIGGSESGVVAKQVLDEVAHLNDKITVVEKNFILDRRRSRTVRRRQVAGDRRALRRAGHAHALLRRADRLRVRPAGRGRAAGGHRKGRTAGRDA